MKAESAALWTKLAESGLVSGDPPPSSETGSPWFVRLMLGVSGWIGALFLLGFVGMGFAFVVESAGASLFTGALLCAGAAFLFRKLPRNDFAAQFGFAVSLAGQILILIGLYRSFGSKLMPGVWIMAAVQALLFAAMPNVLHRVWAAGTGAFAVAWGFGELGLHAVAPGLVAAAFAWVWLREFEEPIRGGVLRAAGHGLALAVALVVVLPGEMWPRVAQAGVFAFWFGSGLSAAVVLVVAMRLLQREGVALSSGPGRIAMVCAALVAVVSLRAPGIGPGVVIVLLGFGNAHQVLTGFGVLTLLAYLVRYYHAMDVTLIVKAGFLAGTGAALLLARIALLRAWPARIERRDA